MESPIKFGTDGWRAVIAEDYTFHNVRACAAAVARYLKRHALAERGLVVGYDTRFASEDFAQAVVEAVAADGIACWLVDRPTPTPAVSYSILDKRAGGAVVVTASHNPWRWNGFKYKPEYAGSASPEVVAEIERDAAEILASGGAKTLPIEQAQEASLVRSFDPRPAYHAQLGRLVDFERLRSAGLRIVADPMYGTGAGHLTELLSDGKSTVDEIHAERNPLFPGIDAPEPIARNLTALSKRIRESSADVGIATDGDADRLGVVDERGEFVDQLQTFALLAYYFLEVRGERGPIVKSITTTRMVQVLGQQYGVPVYETAVGFKYLGPKMTETNALIGGEESGGYGFRGHVPERDGILAGLLFLDLMARTGKRASELLAELYSKVGPHYYDRIDVHLAPGQTDAIRARVEAARPETIAGQRVDSIDTTDGVRFVLDGGWLLVRFSGTEPLMRIYTEVGDRSRVPELLAAGRALAGV